MQLTQAAAHKEFWLIDRRENASAPCRLSEVLAHVFSVNDFVLQPDLVTFNDAVVLELVEGKIIVDDDDYLPVCFVVLQGYRGSFGVLAGDLDLSDDADHLDFVSTGCTAEREDAKRYQCDQYHNRYSFLHCSSPFWLTVPQYTVRLADGKPAAPAHLLDGEGLSPLAVQIYYNIKYTIYQY